MTFLVAIWLFLKRVFFFCIDNWKVVLPIVLVLVGGIFLLRACNKPPKLDQEAIIRAQDAIASREKAKMEEAFAQIEVKDQNIDANVAFSETKKLNALAEARRKAREMSNEDLARALEERLNEN